MFKSDEFLGNPQNLVGRIGKDHTSFEFYRKTRWNTKAEAGELTTQKWRQEKGKKKKKAAGIFLKLYTGYAA